jgi:hypothetical protein
VTIYLRIRVREGEEERKRGREEERKRGRGQRSIQGFMYTMATRKKNLRY